MADEIQMIHGYADEVSAEDFKNRLFIDADVLQDDGTWISKRMLPDSLLWFIDRNKMKSLIYVYNTQTQIQSAINTPRPMMFDVLQYQSNFMLLGNLSSLQYYGDFAQIFNVQFSAQISRTTGGSTETIDIWMRKNGADVPNSNTSVNVQANAGYLVAAWNLVIDLNTNDQIEIMWATTSTAIQLKANPIQSIHPATPSTILSIQSM